MEKKYKNGDPIKYIGKGFLGFDKSAPNANFIKYDGHHSAYIDYKEKNVLVYIWEIESI